jgi:hypothetical protein
MQEKDEKDKRRRKIVSDALPHRLDIFDRITRGQASLEKKGKQKAELRPLQYRLC